MGGGTETRGTGKLGQIDTGPNIRTCRHKSSNLKRAYPLLPTPTRPVVESIFGNRKAVMADGGKGRFRGRWPAANRAYFCPRARAFPPDEHAGLLFDIAAAIRGAVGGRGVWRWASLCVITVRRCVMVVVNDTCSIRW